MLEEIEFYLNEEDFEEAFDDILDAMETEEAEDVIQML